MLRVLILLFVSCMSSANHREPFIDYIRSPPTAFTGKPVNEKPAIYVQNTAIYTEKSVIEPQPKNAPSRRKSKESYTVTARPENVPVPIKPIVARDRTSVEFDDKSFKSNEKVVNENGYQKNDTPIFTGNFQLPLITDKLVNDTEKLAGNTEKPPVVSQPGRGPSRRKSKELYTFTARPENVPNPIKPIVGRERNSPYINSPEFIKKSFSSNENNYPTNYIPTFTDSLQLPLITEKPEIATKKLAENTAKPIIESQPKNAPSLWKSNGFYTFTTRPASLPRASKPIILSRGTTEVEKKADMNLPALMVKSLSFVENPVNEKDFVTDTGSTNLQLPVNTDTSAKGQVLLLNNRPAQLIKLQLPIYTEKLLQEAINNQFLPYGRAKQFYQLQIPVINEKPVVRLVNNQVLHEMYRPLPIFTEKPVNDQRDALKDKLIKEKLVSLILFSKKDLNRQIKNVQSVQDPYKSGTKYKIRYLTTLINKINKKLNNLYKTVQNNKNKWDTLKMFNAYKEVKKNNNLIRHLVKVMGSFFRAKRKLEGPESLVTPGQRAEPASSMSISWSYYDDTIP